MCLSERVAWRIVLACLAVQCAQSIVGIIFGGSAGWIVVSSLGLVSVCIHVFGLFNRRADIAKHLPSNFVVQHVASIVAANVFKDSAGLAVNLVCIFFAAVGTYVAARLHSIWKSRDDARSLGGGQSAAGGNSSGGGGGGEDIPGEMR